MFWLIVTKYVCAIGIWLKGLTVAIRDALGITNHSHHHNRHFNWNLSANWNKYNFHREVNRSTTLIHIQRSLRPCLSVSLVSIRKGVRVDSPTKTTRTKEVEPNTQASDASKPRKTQPQVDWLMEKTQTFTHNRLCWPCWLSVFIQWAGMDI